MMVSQSLILGLGPLLNQAQVAGEVFKICAELPYAAVQISSNTASVLSKKSALSASQRSKTTTPRIVTRLKNSKPSESTTAHCAGN